VDLEAAAPDPLQALLRHRTTPDGPARLLRGV